MPKHAGVSVAPVSRVLPGTYPSAPATRRKVMRAVRELDTMQLMREQHAKAVIRVGNLPTDEGCRAAPAGHRLPHDLLAARARAALRVPDDVSPVGCDDPTRRRPPRRTARRPGGPYSRCPPGTRSSWINRMIAWLIRA
ncbi:LacI family DNA-binding transcriptional regulator [Nonomuraea jabiensis]|uniref:LacI family DNA-binding transcriptional regulator n=1 Tax=Nonomuraea jabiensis TaxID=882448 RepID=UPI00367A20BE